MAEKYVVDSRLFASYTSSSASSIPQVEDGFDAAKKPWPHPAPLPYPARIEEELSVTEYGGCRSREAYKPHGNQRDEDAYTLRYVGSGIRDWRADVALNQPVAGERLPESERLIRLQMDG